LRHALWSKKSLILGLTLLAAAIAFMAVNLITPRYKSEARVLLEMRENIFFRPDAEKMTERVATVDQEAVTSQVQLILSRDLAREVIKKLNLGEKPEFDPVLRGSGLWRSVLSLTGIIKDPLGMTHEERVYRSYYERLSAFQVEKTRVIAIEFESQDPQLAAQVANCAADMYLRFQQAAKQDQTRAAGTWLSGEIERLRTNLAQAEAKVEQYRSKTNLFIGNNNTTLSNQQLGDFNGQLAAARAQKADAEAKAKLIRNALKAGTPIEFSDITNSELMRRLSEQQVTLRAQLAEQSSTLLDQHPRIKELRAQIADLERQMRGEADRLVRSLENDAKLASSKVDAGLCARCAQAPGCLDQRAGCTAARARARCQVAARSARIVSREVPRGIRTRQPRRGRARRANHLDRRSIHHACVAEEAADHPGGSACHVRALIGDHHEQRASSRRADAGRQRHRGSGFDAGVRVRASSRSNPRCASRKTRACRRERADGGA
jgi:polysaccharide biosynthesis transport protein